MFNRIFDSLNLQTEPNRSLVQDNLSVARGIRDVIAHFELLGVSIHPTSRLHQYARLFEGPDDPSSVTLDRALLEVLQFVAVADAFKQSSDARRWIPLLDSATSGHMDCQADRFDSRARSDQFELFIMACLTAAGFRVEPSEPDLRIWVGDVNVALAAKRLRSSGKLEDNLRDARRQLARQRVPGFIVIDVSFMNRLTKPVYVPRLEQHQLMAAIIADGFAEQHQKKILHAAAAPYVLGVLLHASTIGRSMEPATRFVSRRWLLCAANDSVVSRQLVAAIEQLGHRS